MSTQRAPESGTVHCCPFLGTLDARQKTAPYVDYPSFENRCFAAERPAALMLTDQATFCLSSGHRHCPRFVAACAARGDIETRHSPRGPKVAPHSPLDSEQINQNIEALTAELSTARSARLSTRKVWGWIGAGIIFMSSLVCGGLFAAWAGWQMVNSNLLAPPPGRIDTLATSVTALPPQIYLIMTATTVPSSVQVMPALPAVDTSQQAFDFPVAVTPTPVVVDPSLALGAAQSQPQLTDQAANTANAAGPAANIDLAVPTRRPTPILDLEQVVPVAATAAPTETPLPLPTPTLTPTPVPLGEPLVMFSAADAALKTGDCTLVTWDVENVRAVYYENLGVDGHGQKEECMKDRPGEYTLAILTGAGATQLYTVTVDLLRPTETPTVTPTFTPEPILTPTWTPTPVTPTPTPDYQYGVLLALEGDSHSTCTPETPCEIGLLVTNTSVTIDNLAVTLVAKDDWPAHLCRMDGVCADDSLILMNVGPSNTAFILLRVEPPVEAVASAKSYSIQAVSQGSQGSATSQVVEVKVEVP